MLRLYIVQPVRGVCPRLRLDTSPFIEKTTNDKKNLTFLNHSKCFSMDGPLWSQVGAVSVTLCQLQLNVWQHIRPWGLNNIFLKPKKKPNKPWSHWCLFQNWFGPCFPPECPPDFQPFLSHSHSRPCSFPEPLLPPSKKSMFILVQLSQKLEKKNLHFEIENCIYCFCPEVLVNGGRLNHSDYCLLFLIPHTLSIHVLRGKMHRKSWSLM